MSDPCAACGHRDLAEINKRLGSGASIEDIASDYTLTVEDLLKLKQAHITVDEEIKCFYCGCTLEDSEIEVMELVGRHDYYPVCYDCAVGSWQRGWSGHIRWSVRMSKKTWVKGR